MDGRSNNANRRRTAILFFAILLLGALLTPLALYQFTRPSLVDVEAALDRGDLKSAVAMIDGVIRRDRSSKALLLGIQIALLDRRTNDAEQLLNRIEDDCESDRVEVLFACGKLWGEVGRLEESERILRTTVRLAPHHLEANTRLLELLRLEGRHWEAQEFATNLLLQRQFELKYLQIVGAVDASWIDVEVDREFLLFCQQVDPDSPLWQLGTVRLMITRGQDLDMMKELLQEFVATRPELCEAQAMLGELLFETGDNEAFVKWQAEVPCVVEQHPDIWVLYGRWAHRQDDAEGAIRCLWEAIKRFPNDGVANVLMAKLLIAVGRHDDAMAFQRRGDLLVRLENQFYRQYSSAASVELRIGLLEELDRHWEAYGWCEKLLDIAPYSTFARDAMARLEPHLDVNGPLTPASANPALAIDLQEYPLPDTKTITDETAALKTHHGKSIQFRDRASEVGLNFEYFVDFPRKQDNVFSFDFAGGGAGVIDFDCDGWPDIYLSQSRHYPSVDEADEPRDSLFWNQRGEFVDAAEFARIDERQFGHGISVGDYNSDGFPDLHVNNLGSNRLYLNNGDGTFEDVTGPSRVGGDSFSLSSAFADFNGDSLPDLYIVNYLGADALELQCMHQGKRSQCSPLKFPGQPDQLYVNLGDGRFREMAAETGIHVTDDPGKGMGLLVGDFDGRDGLDVYVANDTSANHFYFNRDSGTEQFHFVEQGRVAGVAYSATGRLEGSMGIAANDVNCDGMLDIFVTNYKQEANNLFAQIAQAPQPIYSDLALEWNLSRSSTPLVGWGAQFLDADLDGDSDLIVANGHVDENATASEPAQVPFLFENTGAGFTSIPDASDYFQTKMFGRAVARIDWNCDGLPDLCITHMGTPVSLLTNWSERQGNFVVLELRGVQASRDAIGAVVEVNVGEQSWCHALLSGDGFSASNQRHLLMGIGKADEIESLKIRWPRGEPQEIRNLAANSRWLIIQGDATPHQR